MYVFLRVLLVCAALSVSGVFGQSLSITKANRQYSIEASAPAENPGALQATDDLRLWIDVTNQVTDPSTILLKHPHYSTRFFRLIPAPPEAPPIRIIALGDSLIADDMGWGGGVYGFLKPNATFVNWAYPGDSSVTTIQFHLNTMKNIKPQYVMFQFGATDMAQGVTEQKFEENLKAIIDGVRGWGGVPYLVTVNCLRTFDHLGNFIPYDLPYNAITRRVAAEKEAPLIDLNKIMADLYTKLGPVGSQPMAYIHPQFPNDAVHLSPLGAVWVSQAVLKSLPPSFGPYFTEKLLDPPESPSP